MEHLCTGYQRLRCVSEHQVPLIRATPSVPGAISGSLTACPNTSGVPYTIAPMAGAVSYVWTSSSPSVSVSAPALPLLLTSVPDFTVVTSALQVSLPVVMSDLRVHQPFWLPGIPGTISGPSICPGSSSTHVIGPVQVQYLTLWSTTGSGISVSGFGYFGHGNFDERIHLRFWVCVIAVVFAEALFPTRPQRCKSVVSGKLNTRVTSRVIAYRCLRPDLHVFDPGACKRYQLHLDLACRCDRLIQHEFHHGDLQRKLYFRTDLCLWKQRLRCRIPALRDRHGQPGQPDRIDHHIEYPVHRHRYSGELECRPGATV